MFCLEARGCLGSKGSKCIMHTLKTMLTLERNVIFAHLTPFRAFSTPSSAQNCKLGLFWPAFWPFWLNSGLHSGLPRAI